MISSLIYHILGGAARRWYGGAFPEDKHPILGNRALQTVCMIVLFMSIYVVNPSSWQCWLWALAISCWLQFQFWSRSHGCGFDMGRDKNPSEETIERYKARWYHYVCDAVLPNHKYGFLYDCLYMLLRYTCPLIPLAVFFDYRYLFIGFEVTAVYAFCWTLEERESWLFSKKPQWLDKGTKLAEIICGGIVFGACAYLKWGL